MTQQPVTTRSSRSLLPALAALVLAWPLAAQDEEQGCLKWSQRSDPALWIPDQVALADHGAALITARYLTGSYTSVHTSGSAQSAFDLPVVTGEQTRIAAAAEAPVFARGLARRIAQGSTWGLHVEQIDTTGDGSPRWSHTFPFVNDGRAPYVALTRDGGQLVAVARNPAANEVWLEAFDGRGASLASHVFAGTQIVNAFDASTSAGRVALELFGMGVLVFDVATGTLEPVDNEPGSSTRGALSLSADGNRLALGGEVYQGGQPYGRLVILERDATGAWSTVFRREYERYTEVRQVDLSARGERVAFTVEDPFLTGFTVHLLDLEQQRTVFEHPVRNPSTLLQLVSSALQVDDRGRTVAVASWGDSGQQTPEVLVLDERGQRVCSLHTRGSALGVALTPAGDRYAACATARHLNSFSNKGDVYYGLVPKAELDTVGLPRPGDAIGFRIAPELNEPGWFVLVSGERLPLLPERGPAIDPGALLGDPIPASSLTGASWDLPLELAGVALHLQAFCATSQRSSNVTTLRILQSPATR